MPMHTLAGSERSHLPGARDLGEADPQERLQVTVLIRRRASGVFSDRVAALATGGATGGHLTREEFAGQFGADPADAAAVAEFAAAHGLTVASEDLPRRTLILSGRVSAFNAAFAVDLRRMSQTGGDYRGRTGAVHLPAELQDIVQAVLGLDNRPQATPHFRRHSKRTAPTSFTPPQIAALYGFPAGNGAGECVAIIELGGGYTPADLAAYFGALGVSPTPSVTAVSVDQGANSPTGDASGPDGEVMLDIEVVGAIAPAASIVVYFAPNTDAGFIDAVTTAAHDATHKPSVISISWGGPESSWTSQSLTAFDQALQAAAAMGVTVCVASGDSGSSDGVASGDHVDFPASSPYALACGGTSLRASGGKIASETVWNDGAKGGAGGGGLSAVFPLPAWQKGLSVAGAKGAPAVLTMRGVPDVAGDADPETGYMVRIDATDTVIGGTSAVAPLWAALLAIINGQRGAPVGFIHPLLYVHVAAFRDITEGNNGDYAAGPGWDACTGLGSPLGTAIQAALRPAA
jgi:kumamolisin